MIPVICIIFQILLAGIANVHGDGELLILHSPEALRFRGNDAITSSELKDMFASSLGYTVERNSEWTGMEINTPFQFAIAVVVFHLTNIQSLGTTYGHKFPLVVDTDIGDTYDDLTLQTEERFPNENVMMKVLMEDKMKVSGTPDIITDEIFKHNISPVLSLNHLLPDVEVDKKFIREINQLHAVVDEVLKKQKVNSVPDIYWFGLPNVGNVSLMHGMDSLSTMEAKKLMANAIKASADKFKTFYHDQVLIVAITETSDVVGLRLKREATDSTGNVTLESLNVAEDYDENFPVVFNIVLWLSMALLFSVIAISIAIGTMDPGRDSIIYRMTSTRMKKDN